MLHFEGASGRSAGVETLTVKTERTLAIPADPDAIWAVLADFTTISRWAPKVEHSAPASGAHGGIGAVRRVQVGRLALLETVTEWEPSRRLSYLVAGLPPAAGAVTTTWQISPQNGAAVASVTSVIEPGPGPAGRIASRVVLRALAKAAEAMLGGLAQHVCNLEEQP